MGHAHSHTHSQPAPGQGGGRRLLITLVLNLGITAAQVIGGVLAGSLALLADAVHNFSDAASIGISYGARRIAERAADRRRTFGYQRAEVVAALINLVTLVVISLYLLGYAVERFFHPRPIEGTLMLIVGGIAFVEDLISAVLLYRGARESINVKSVFLHMLGDTLATVGVIVGSLAIMVYGVSFIDPLLTALIALYILVHGGVELKDVIRILMESAPPGFEYDRMMKAMQQVDGVEDVHHVHVWQLDEERTALEAHVAIARRDLEEMERIKRDLKQMLQADFEVEHATLEIEFACGTEEEGAAPPRSPGTRRWR